MDYARQASDPADLRRDCAKRPFMDWKLTYQKPVAKPSYYFHPVRIIVYQESADMPTDGQYESVFPVAVPWLG